MGVAINDTGTEMHRLEIAAYNGAMLSNMKTHDVSFRLLITCMILCILL